MILFVLLLELQFRNSHKLEILLLFSKFVSGPSCTFNSYFQNQLQTSNRQIKSAFKLFLSFAKKDKIKPGDQELPQRSTNLNSVRSQNIKEVEFCTKYMGFGICKYQLELCIGYMENVSGNKLP